MYVLKGIGVKIGNGKKNCTKIYSILKTQSLSSFSELFTVRTYVLHKILFISFLEQSDHILIVFFSSRSPPL